MRLYLISPHNNLATLGAGMGIRGIKNLWMRFRNFKPLGLLTIAALTPSEWEIKVFDENISVPNYLTMPMPDLVGISAFTSQAPRAYEVATLFRKRGVPVVIGGIHASMCPEEASRYADSVVMGEAESVWKTVLDDVRKRTLKSSYIGTFVEGDKIAPARHDLLQNEYFVGAIQTARGCPFNCSFCSVTSFNGGRYRYRPVEDLIKELKLIREKYLFIIDDNIIGFHDDHKARAKELFRAMIKADIGKKWGVQATINIADDDELLELAAKAGCRVVFIGFETLSKDGFREINKICKMKDFQNSVKRIRQKGIRVQGSFVIGLDVDQKGVGKLIADTSDQYGMDFIVVQVLTPLPGTRLWNKMKSENRILAINFPEDWKYYTFGFPVAQYANLSSKDMIDELDSSYETFYSYGRILRRLLRSLRHLWDFIFVLTANLGFRSIVGLNRKTFKEYYKRIGGVERQFN